MNDYNLSRGGELFRKKINEIMPLVDVEARTKFAWLADQYEGRVGVMQKNDITEALEKYQHLKSNTDSADAAAMHTEISQAVLEFVPSYTKLATSIAGVAHSSETDLEKLHWMVLEQYQAGGCSEYVAPKKSLVPTVEQQVQEQLLREAAHTEIDQHAIKKKTWKELVIKRDAEGNILYNEHGAPITEEVEVSNATLSFGTDEEGNLLERELLIDDLDLMDDFDEDDLTVEGQRAAGMIPLGFDTLSGQDASSARVASFKNKLPFGQVRAKEDGSWEIVCPFTGSTDVYQIDSNTYASFETDQPFRIEASLSDLRED
jgi:hypothetical protein